MFLDVGEPRRALDQFSAALRSVPEHEQAVTGAGQAAFELGDYPRARRYFVRTTESSPAVNELKRITDLLLTRDPLERRIGRAERRRRLVVNLDGMAERLTQCFGQLASQGRTAGSALESLRGELEALRTSLRRRRQPIAHDVAEDALDLIVRIEQTMGDLCGSPTPLDRALLLIARRHDIGTP
jgi:tetratricopeptide (TPR) repeat protein